MSIYDYEFADLSSQSVEKLRETENILNSQQNADEEIIILAFKPSEHKNR